MSLIFCFNPLKEKNCCIQPLSKICCFNAGDITKASVFRGGHERDPEPFIALQIFPLSAKAYKDLVVLFPMDSDELDKLDRIFQVPLNRIVDILLFLCLIPYKYFTLASTESWSSIYTLNIRGCKLCGSRCNVGRHLASRGEAQECATSAQGRSQHGRIVPVPFLLDKRPDYHAFGRRKTFGTRALSQ